MEALDLTATANQVKVGQAQIEQASAETGVIIGVEGALRGRGKYECWQESRQVTKLSVVTPLGLEPRTNGLKVHCSAN